MLTILYSVLIYIGSGSLTYLVGQHYSNKELTHFQKTIFRILGILFYPIIKAIQLIDTIIFITKASNTVKSYSPDEIQKIIDIVNNSDDGDKDE